MSPCIDAVDLRIKSSDTVTFPVTFPAISAFSAITFPSTIEVSPQATFDFEDISPITLPSNLILPDVLKFPSNHFHHLLCYLTRLDYPQLIF